MNNIVVNILLLLTIIFSYSVTGYSADLSKTKVHVQCKKIKDREKRVKCIASQVSKKHNISTELVLSILKIESNYCKYKVNSETNDYGCMQINEINFAKLKRIYNITKHDLMTNEEKSIEAGVLILKEFKMLYKHKEPKLWPCRYNVGTVRNLASRKTACKTYLKKLSLEKYAYVE